MQLRAELIDALFGGISETPPWASFLRRLRGATHADYATLSFPPRTNELEKTTTIVADAHGCTEIGRGARQDFFPEDRYAWVSELLPEEGRPYSRDDLFGTGSTEREAFYLDLIKREGLSAILQMRVCEKSGANCWLTLTRGGADFPANDADLLRDLAPVLRGVLQLYVERERAQFAATLHAETARRLQFGWLTLDTKGRILECDERGGLMLEQSRDISARPGGLVSIRSSSAQQVFQSALKDIISKPDSRPRGILVSREPWLNLLLMAPRGKLLSGGIQPAAIACLQGDSLASSDRAEQIAEFFGLSRREAQLALALSRGLSLTEAASEFGLKIATIRTYSKSLYSKIGARGLADLVRIVMSSVMATAPSI